MSEYLKAESSRFDPILGSRFDSRKISNRTSTLVIGVENDHMCTISTAGIVSYDIHHPVIGGY